MFKIYDYTAIIINQIIITLSIKIKFLMIFIDSMIINLCNRVNFIDKY